MIVLYLGLIGLCLGSFVSALTWRLHEQTRLKDKIKSLFGQRLSMINGRSMCTHCHHQLAWYDLMPVISWLSLGGRCRYCRKSISLLYPALELGVATLFILSYLLWPLSLVGPYGIAAFGLWLVLLVIFVALTVYDLKWMILPDVLVWPAVLISLILLVLRLQIDPDPASTLLSHVAGALIGPALFGGFYIYSKGRWIGLGDVKLSLLMGIILGLSKTLVALTLASYSALLLVLPLLALKKIKRSQPIPFGPFLIAGTIAAFLIGDGLISWYQQMSLPSY